MLTIVRISSTLTTPLPLQSPTQCESEDVTVTVGDGSSVGDALGVGVLLGVAVAVIVAVSVGGTVAVGVAVSVGLAVSVAVSVSVALAEGDEVGVIVGVPVAVGRRGMHMLALAHIAFATTAQP